MNILAIESSATRCSVALRCQTRVMQHEAAPGASHSEAVLPLVSALLAEAGIVLSGIDAIAFGAGPGGFTGVRLACGVAQGLAFAAGLPVVAVGSLAALAWRTGAQAVLTCVDARMNEVYWAAYRRTPDGLVCVSAPAVGAPETVEVPPGNGWTGVGSGFAAYEAGLAGRLRAPLAGCKPELQADAAAVAELGEMEFAAGRGIDPARAAPLYVRDKVALTSLERAAHGARA